MKRQPSKELEARTFLFCSDSNPKMHSKNNNPRTVVHNGFIFFILPSTLYTMVLFYLYFHRLCTQWFYFLYTSIDSVIIKLTGSADLPILTSAVQMSFWVSWSHQHNLVSFVKAATFWNSAYFINLGTIFCLQ